MLGLIAWCLAALAAETRSRLAWLARAQEEAVFPPRWQLGAARVEHYAGFLRRLEPLLPPGSRVTVVSSYKHRKYDTFLAMWAAYLLPRQQVISSLRPEAEQAEYWIAYRRPLQRPDLEPVVELRAGGLYKVVR